MSARIIAMTPVGTVRSTRRQPTDDNWSAETSRIELDPAQFTADSLVGLSDFSHVEVFFYMDQMDPLRVEKGLRHPRENPAWPKVGIFAQRGKSRPNQIGATICRIKRVEGSVLHLENLDAIDGTPVLDLKPWVQEYAPQPPLFQPKWVSELMARYWRT